MEIGEYKASRELYDILQLRASFPDSVLKEIKKERGWVELAVGVTNGNPWIKLYSWREEYGALFDVK